MLRRAFIRRMIFAGLATWFLDLPLPSVAEADGITTDASAIAWRDISFRDAFGRETSISLDGSAPYSFEVGASYTLEWSDVEGGPVSERMDGMVCTGIVESRPGGTLRAVSGA